MENRILKYVQMACQGDCDDCLDAEPDPCVHSAKQITRLVVEEVEEAIRGRYPQGNSYGDQMERVVALLGQLKEATNAKTD